MTMRASVVLASVVAGLGLAPLANAALIGVAQNGPGTGDSSAEVAAEIIAAPSDALDDFVTNSAQQGFDEAQGVVTTRDYTMDGGTVLAAGTRVNSHMIFLNSEGNTLVTHFDVEWEFDGLILGVMSDGGGTLEAASTGELGAAGTNYTAGPGAPPFTARGLEADDGYTIDGALITVNMQVTEPGDWIRVITAADPVVAIPEPHGVALLGLGLVALGLVRRRRLNG